jgi:hypothetical protein
MGDPIISVNVHGNGKALSVKRHSERVQWLQIGDDLNVATVFLDDADLTRLRDVIDAHLANTQKKEAA